MVLSRINESINYPSQTKVFDEDVEHNSTLYEVDSYELMLKILIAIGKQKYIYADKNVIFFPIYLVYDKSIIMPIGIFEIPSHKLPFVMNGDELDISRLDNNNPLFYDNITTSLIEEFSLDNLINHDENVGKKEEMDDKDDSDKEEDKEDKENYDKDDDDKEEKEIKEETSEQAKRYKQEYVEKINSLWIEKFLHNNHYNIIDNEGDGDCLFAAIRDSYIGIGKHQSIEKLRSIVSNKATEDIFDMFRSNYEMFDNSIKNDNANLKTLKDDNKQLKQKHSLTKDRETQKKIQSTVKENIEKYNKIKSELAVTKDLIQDYEFMKNIKSLKQFKDVILTKDFWGEAWSISVLEKELKIKIILLSSQSFEDGDKDNVVNCGQQDDELEVIGEFKPEKYIIMDYTGNHYKLITYNDKTMFVYKELPYDLKQLIVLKCMEKDSGPYNLIPEFKSLKNNVSPYISTDTTQVENDNLFKEVDNVSEDIVFQIYHKSSDKPLPGKGAGEKIPTEEIKNFSELQEQINWRRKLSDSWISPIVIDNYTWSSVDHYYYGNMYKHLPEIYKKFTLESKSSISDDAIKAKDAATTKTSSYLGKGIQKNPEFDKMSNILRERALEEKFSKNDELKNILLKTKNANLTLYKRGSEAEPLISLMKIRKNLLS